MINAESFVYNEVVTALRVVYPKIFVSGDPSFDVKSFPTVIFSEMTNMTASRYLTQEPDELFTDVMFEAQAFSNKTSGRRRETKEMIDTIDGVMRGLGFVRTMGQPLANLADTTIARYVGRWHGTIGSDGYIYRR